MKSSYLLLLASTVTPSIGVEENCGTADTYRGFHVKDLQYALTEEMIKQTRSRVSELQGVILRSLENLEHFDMDDVDLGVMIRYLNDYCEECLSEYSMYLDKVIYELNVKLGKQSLEEPFNPGNPYNIAPAPSS